MSNHNADLKPLVIIKGAGDLATGVAHRLHRCGLRLLMSDLAQPTAIRRTVSFAQAIYDGEITVEGISAQRADGDNFEQIQAAGKIPVLPGPDPHWLENLAHRALIEATLSKKNSGVKRKPGRITLALGPGYQAGLDVDGVIETARGHFLGRLITNGSASANTGRPGLIGGYDLERLIRSPGDGVVNFDKTIGAVVKKGELLGQVGEADIIAAIDGVLRGALTNGLTVSKGFKIGDIDPRPEAVNFIHSPSDKARAVAGGVLEALFYFGFPYCGGSFGRPIS